MTGTWQKNKKRTLEWAKKERARLITELGGKCVHCGSTEKLQFHHTVARTWIASKLNRWSRLARYKEDIAAGHIELACKPCNQKLGEPKREYDPQPESSTPDWDNV